MVYRNRTPSKYVGYALYFYFSGLSLRRTAERLSSCFIKRNHVSIWNWIQKFKPQKILSKKINVLEYIIDETLIKIGSELVWLWVAIEPKHRQILHIDISFERSMLIAERFIAFLIKRHGKHPVSTDGGTWYPQACKFLKLEHHIHSSYEKSLIERTMQYLKDRTESFDDYFPCKRKEKCKLKHVIKWLKLFVDYHNKEKSLK
ncbi:MAG TPA: DDE-type integrase/transposase/recombinase [Candidatus Nitrosocosmicus sp.]|nr:DDE-type integrase/transposase/recombinase [Candidatus Nitrosocosmicus sp.]